MADARSRVTLYRMQPLGGVQCEDPRRIRRIRENAQPALDQAAELAHDGAELSVGGGGPNRQLKQAARRFFGPPAQCLRLEFLVAALVARLAFVAELPWGLPAAALVARLAFVAELPWGLVGKRRAGSG
jgi:hypothetical protein